MTLYLIGIGLENQKDITLKGLEAVKKCSKVYAESYTSLLQCTFDDLESFYGKKIIVADRAMSEQGDLIIIQEAKHEDVAFLIIGDPFSATTHVELFRLAKEQNVNVKVIHNASILTSIGIVGLQLYKYGRIASIPFIEDHPQLETPYRLLQQNQYLDMHTLFLLDLTPGKNRFMTVNQALEILEQIESRKKENLIKSTMVVIGCARLGWDNYLIKSGTIEELKKFDFGPPPHCLIIPSKLHFVEQEMINLWK
ncbi:diphthine synthase [Candidatus Woesearchaeota archaeon]|nr:diphthine synthase [Candidatus Woesearchaeota archaeon]